MKKYLIISMFFLSAFGYANNLSVNTIEDKVSPQCWAAADAAEANHCGYVGCSFEYWAGYYEGCSAR